MASPKGCRPNKYSCFNSFPMREPKLKKKFHFQLLCIAYQHIISSHQLKHQGLSRYDGVRYGLRVGWRQPTRNECEHENGRVWGRSQTKDTMLGTYALSVGTMTRTMGKFQSTETLSGEFAELYKDFDVLSPTSPCTAFKLGAKVDDPMTMYVNDVCTILLILSAIQPCLSRLVQVRMVCL